MASTEQESMEEQVQRNVRNLSSKEVPPFRPIERAKNKEIEWDKPKFDPQRIRELAAEDIWEMPKESVWT